MMSASLLAAFLVFAFVSSVTPGPNTMMLLASGVNFGLKRTLWHLAGVNVGFPLMLLLSGLGFGAIFERYPAIYSVMKIIGILYMLWLAWKIARAAPMGAEGRVGQPMSFLQAIVFQWINPKAWAIVIGAIAAYTVPEHFVETLVTITAVYIVAGIPASLIWVVFGAGMRNFLRDPVKVKWFNWAMAMLLVASLIPTLLDYF